MLLIRPFLATVAAMGIATAIAYASAKDRADANAQTAAMPAETAEVTRSAASPAAIQLIAALDGYLRAVTDAMIGPAEGTEADATDLEAARVAARAMLIAHLQGSGLTAERAERLVAGMSDPATPVTDVADGVRGAFPKEDHFDVWFDRLATRGRGGNELVYVPSLLAAPQSEPDPDLMTTAKRLAGLSPDAPLSVVHGSSRTRTLRELLIGTTHVTPVVGGAFVVDTDELEKQISTMKERLDRLARGELAEAWGLFRIDANSLSGLSDQDTRATVLAQHLLRAFAEQRLHNDPDILVALRAGVAIREVHMSLDVASHLEVVSRVPSMPARSAFMDLLASPGVSPFVSGSATSLDEMDPDGLALHALLVAASFSYPGDLRGEVLPPSASSRVQATVRFVNAASGRYAPAGFGTIARGARDRLVREALMHAARAVLERGSSADDALLMHLLETVVRGEPQDTELLRIAVVFATNQQPRLIDVEPWLDDLVRGYLNRRIIYGVSTEELAQTVGLYARDKVARNEFHEAATLAAMALTWAPKDFEMRKIMALGAANAGRAEASLYWAREAEAVARTQAERAEAARLRELIEQAR